MLRNQKFRKKNLHLQYMADTILSPDGKWMWTGSEWIPAPPTTEPESESISMSDNVLSDDVTNTQKSAENLAMQLMQVGKTLIPSEFKSEVLVVKNAVPNANEEEILEAFIRSRDEFQIQPKDAVVGIIEFFQKQTKSGIKMEVNPAPMPVDLPPSNSKQWHHLFVKDSVDCWEGNARATRKNMKVGRLIIAEEGIVFVSTGSAKLGKRFVKYLISPRWAARSGPSTVHLDSTDLSKAGSLKIPKSDLTSFRVEGGFWYGRILLIHSRSNGVYSFCTKGGFKKSDAKTLNRFEIDDLW